MKNLTLLLTMVFYAFGLSAQDDCDSCKDYPLLPRMPEFHITVYKEVAFDSEKFYVGREPKTIAGKKYKIEYTHDYRDAEDRVFPSRLQILKNYSNAIEKAGGSTLFERHNAEHGYYSFINTEGQEIWVKLRTVLSGKRYYLIVIEREEMEQDITINAELIKTKIELYGKIAVYGIYFDVGESVVKSESQAALEQIALYLSENPEVKLWVVGHTDSDGSFELNSELSLARSEAIRIELETTYGVKEGRLFAEGVGPLAPVASNKTENGKAKNRRVEFVLK